MQSITEVVSMVSKRQDGCEDQIHIRHFQESNGVD